MRFATLGLVAAVLASPAFAADLDYGVLRGSDDDYAAPAPIIDWSGFYVGGHGGYSSTAMGFKNALQPSFAERLRARDIESEFGVSSLLSLPSRREHGGTYGAYAGYNVQFDEFVAGVEVDYTRFNQTGRSSAFIGRDYTTAAGNYDTAILSGVASTKIEDYGTIRGRAGYAFGDFLPFVTAGLAIGRATITQEGYIQNFGYDRNAYTANQAQTTGAQVAVANHGYARFNPNYPQPFSTPAGGGVQTVPAPAAVVVARSKSRTIAGLALGAGLEYALTPNIMLRGEYQYVLFDDFDGHKANINTVRGGAAIKF
ncbi:MULTISPECIES: outer membrane protein [unclassified Methylobacterium]|uniref:outer membrane protein n=1 Tax=unclassified Methylobacterium TaxID=2615210 RepID=UPI0036FE0A2F